MLLLMQTKAAFMHAQFQSDIVRPMNIENALNQEVKMLSSGELQRMAIVLEMGKPNMDIYLIDKLSLWACFAASLAGLRPN